MSRMADSALRNCLNSFVKSVINYMSSTSSLKERTAKGLLWGGFSNGIVQLLNLVFGICLLRMLTDTDYGMVQVLAVFTAIAGALQDSGFMTALINKKDASADDYNSVFWFNVLTGLLMYVILFLCAPLIADFYHSDELVALSRFLFLSFLFSGWGIAQRAYLYGHLMVRESSLILIVSLAISGIVSVTMAYYGFAYWGLAAQTVVYTGMTTLLNWVVSPWRPTFRIDFGPVRRMFRFSSKLLVATIFMQINRNVFSLLLGRFYTKALAGQYGNAAKWNDMGTTLINGMLNGVALPVLARVKDDRDRYRAVFRKMLRFTSFVSFPAMLGLGLISPEFILLVAGEKWLPSVGMLQILSIYGAFYPIITLYSNLVISQEHTSINLYNTVALSVVTCGILVGMHPFGIYPMIVAFVTVNILWLFVWQHFAFEMIGLRIIDALRDMLPFLGLALLSMLVAWVVSVGMPHASARLALKVAIAAAVYVGSLYASGSVMLRESIAFLRKRGHIVDENEEI